MVTTYLTLIRGYHSNNRHGDIPIVHTDGDNVKTYGKLTGIDFAMSNTQQYDIITIT